MACDRTQRLRAVVISLLIPTRGHAQDRLPLLWKSIQKTITEWSSLETLFRVDEDDHESFKFLDALRPRVRIFVGKSLEGYKSLPIFFNELASHARGSLLMCGNDDIQFQTPDWNLEYLKASRQMKDFRFNLGCWTYPTSAVPFSVISRKAYEKLGYLNDPSLVYSDVFLRDVFGHFGGVRCLPQIQILHTGVPDESVNQLKWNLHLNAAEYWAHHNECVKKAVRKLQE